MAIIEYDKSLNITPEQRLKSLADSVRRAFEEIEITVGDSEETIMDEDAYPRAGGVIEGDAIVDGTFAVRGNRVTLFGEPEEEGFVIKGDNPMKFTSDVAKAGTRQNLGIVDAIYPIGAVYISYVSTSPAELFGGSWTAITGIFPYFNAGTATGGSNTHTLTLAQIPSHAHNLGVYVPGSTSTWYFDNAGSLQSGSGAGAYPYTSGSKSIITATANNGSSGAHNNMPAYQTFYAWRRTE